MALLDKDSLLWKDIHDDNDGDEDEMKVTTQSSFMPTFMLLLL